MGTLASSSASRSRRIVLVVTPHCDARSSIVTPAERACSISRRIVHWRMTSAFLGTHGLYSPRVPCCCSLPRRSDDGLLFCEEVTCSKGSNRVLGEIEQGAWWDRARCSVGLDRV